MTVEAPLKKPPHAGSPDPLKLIDATFPAKSGEYVKVHHIAYQEYYRVNFHAHDTNCIVRSYFVRCINGKAENINA